MGMLRRQLTSLALMLAPLGAGAQARTISAPTGASLLDLFVRQWSRSSAMGDLRELATHLPALALDPRDGHSIVGRGLVSHPGDHGGLGPLFHRDSLRPGDRAAADRRGMIGHSLGQPVSEISVCGMEGQERHDRPVEVLDVHGLGLLSTAGVGFLLLNESFGGSLGFEVGTNSFNGRSRSPDSS